MPRQVKYSTRRKTFLRNTSRLGYSRYHARAGDLVLYKEHYQDGTHSLRAARVIGVITETDTDGLSGEGKLLVCAVADTLSYGYERWVDPDDVVDCYGSKAAMHFLSWFFQAAPGDLHKYNRDDPVTHRAATLCADERILETK